MEALYAIPHVFLSLIIIICFLIFAILGVMGLGLVVYLFYDAFTYERDPRVTWPD